MLRITLVGDDWVVRAISRDRVNFSGTPFDIEAFYGAQPLLQRVFAVLRSVQEQLHHRRHDNDETIIWACLADFDGDPLAFYNEIGLSEYNKIGVDGGVYTRYRYNPDRFDKTSGLPICYRDRRGSHDYIWSNDADFVARLWPVTAPNLQTIYAIDSGIKLKPGASIPPGTQTFKGNNCLYVEVPRPVCRSLEKGGEDAIWQYPTAGDLRADVFEFARHMESVIVVSKNSHLRRVALTSSNDNIDDLRKEEADAHYRRVEDSRVPECRILAILEE
jgi:hypothetical protein